MAGDISGVSSISYSMRKNDNAVGERASKNLYKLLLFVEKVGLAVMSLDDFIYEAQSLDKAEQCSPSCS